MLSAFFKTTSVAAAGMTPMYLSVFPYFWQEFTRNLTKSLVDESVAEKERTRVIGLAMKNQRQKARNRTIHDFMQKKLSWSRTKNTPLDFMPRLYDSAPPVLCSYGRGNYYSFVFFSVSLNHGSIAKLFILPSRTLLNIRTRPFSPLCGFFFSKSFLFSLEKKSSHHSR